MNIFGRFLITVFIAIASAGANASDNYVVLTEGLSLEPARYLSETIDVVETRIRAWESALAEEGLGVKRLLSSPYGSAFLKFNKKGMDQDYLCVFDLGVLKDGSSKEQALELIGSLNKLFRVITGVNRTMRGTAALYVYDHGPVDKSGNLELGSDIVSMIATQIDAVQTNRKKRTAFHDSKGHLVPTDVYPFEIILPVNTRIKMATNTVKYYQEMFSGIRDISLQIFFSVGLIKQDEIIYINVSPLYDKLGVPISFFDAMVKNVFLSGEDVQTYQKRLMHLPAKDIILRSVVGLYRASLRESDSGDYLKEIKRLHHIYNGLRWAFSRSDQSEIELAFTKWLHSEWAITAADLVEQATMWLKADEAMRGAFINARSLDALTLFLIEAVKLEAKYPRLKPEMDEIRGVIRSLKNEGYRAKKLKQLEVIGQKVSEKIGPTKEEMDQLLRLFGEKLEELGFKSIHIYRIRNGKVSLSRREILAAGLVPEKANLPPEQGGIKKIGGYDYVVIDRLGRGEAPLKTVVFRSVFTGAPAAKFDAYYESISHSLLED
jgi:hypothetical protein